MSKFPLLCFCLLGPSFLFAQYDDLLKNPDISWVAEYTADFSLDPSVPEVFNFLNFSNDLNVAQFSDMPGASGLFENSQNYGRYFSQKIMADIQGGKYLFFEDDLLEVPIPAEKIKERALAADTVVTFDPETYEENIRILSEFDWRLMSGFRVRQVFYYNKTDKIYGSRVLALAPLVFPKDWEETMANEVKPLLWIKIDLPKSTEKITSRDVVYAFETKMRGNAPRFSDFVLKKGRMDFSSLITNEVARPSHVILDGNFAPIAPENLQQLVLYIDTVTTFNPETYAERTEIVQHNAIKDVERISFVQQWFFDDRKRIFFNRVTAVTPLVAVKDEEGNFLYSKVLFYMLNK